MSLEWEIQLGGEEILFDTENGKIIGRITKVKDSYYAFYNSAILGEYVSLEFAKSAIENPPAPKTQEPPKNFKL
jgi:hypothetical protein